MSTDIFDLIHSDVWGPSPVSNISGSRYFIVFVDDYSRYSWIFHIKHCSELLQVYSNFAKMVKTQFSKQIKIFQYDNVLEYTQYAFQAILHSYGTIHQLTCPSASQQNGRAERKFCHILDTVHALILSAKVPAPFWGEVDFHVIHAINRILSPVIQNQTPYEHLFGSPPYYHHLCSFGSTCFILFQPHKHNKLELQSKLCCFLGYSKTQKRYQCYDPVSHRLCISCNVVFWEHRSFVELSYFRASLSTSSILDLFPDEPHIPFIVAPGPPIDFFVQPLDIFYASLGSPSNEYVEDEQVEDQPPNLEFGFPTPTSPKYLTQDIPPRYSTRVRSIPVHLLDYHCYTALATLQEPQTYHKASIDPF